MQRPSLITLMVVMVVVLVMLSRGYLVQIKDLVHEKVREDW